MARKSVVALIGATATGKTNLSLTLAESLNAEIISVDSRQVYRYMDVGTDKIPMKDRKNIIHHLIDIADPDENFTVSDFAELASKTAERIFERGKNPLFVGGTPFYYHALFHKALNSELPSSSEIRAKYETLANSQGAELLHMRLAEVDPDSAERLHVNDIQRVTRALELYELTGKTPSEIYNEGAKRDFGFDILYIGLTRPREELFKRITERLANEFQTGFVEEVIWLVKNGFDERFKSMRGLGYREILEYYRGKTTLNEALLNSVSRTKAFCRRQDTWFKKFEPAIWFDISETNHVDEILDVIKKHLSGENLNHE